MDILGALGGLGAAAVDSARLVVETGVKTVAGATAMTADGLNAATQTVAGAFGQVAVGVRDQAQQLSFSPQAEPPRKTVFVVHGRDDLAWEAMRDYLKALGLSPQNFRTLVNGGQLPPPKTIQQVLERAFEVAHAVVVLFTPDEQAQLLPELGKEAERLQPRANVFVEAGMALGMHRERTVLVKFHGVRLPTDLESLVAVEFYQDDAETREALLGQLRATKVQIRRDGERYLEAGAFKSVLERIHGRVRTG
jgi:predicted nucleotide-binding protein